MAPSTMKTPGPLAVQLIAAAILGSAGVYAVVGVVLVHLEIVKPIVEPDLSGMLGTILIILGPLSALSSFPLRRMLMARTDGTLADKMRITIICMSVAESAGVLGLVYAILCGNLGPAFVLWGASLGAGIFHLPTRAWLGEDRGDK